MNPKWQETLKQLLKGGHLASDWLPAFEAVDRGAFIPSITTMYNYGNACRKHRDEEPDVWTEAVYSDRVVVIEVDNDGIPISSSSQPSIMAIMLRALNVRDGMKVLEIGTGSGYNAALLAHRLGSENVTTVEIDRELAEQARRRLAEAGFGDVTVVVGDGKRGAPEHALFDRIILTHAVLRIEPTWVNQLKPKGIIVAPVQNQFGTQTVIKLERKANGDLKGEHIVGCAFMCDRTTREPPDLPRTETLIDRTSIPPSYFEDGVELGLWLSQELPTVQLYDHSRGLIFHDTATDSICYVGRVPDSTDRWPVYQLKGERFWEKISGAVNDWFSAGQPGLDRFPFDDI